MLLPVETQALADVSRIIERPHMSWVRKLDGSDVVLISHRLALSVGRAMNNDDRWPLPGSRYDSNPERTADYCKFPSRGCVLA